MPEKQIIETALSLTRELAREAGEYTLSRGDITIYNPLDYAWEPHEQYLRTFGAGGKRVLFLGMNPGPWGMAQTGIPFGDVQMVTDWLRIDGHVGRPQREHPKRPVLGFATSRREVSGSRLWGFFRQRFGSAEVFFADHLVLNYCPLVFMEDSGKNLTPDKLPKADRDVLERLCDAYLLEMVRLYEPDFAVGVGKYAMGKFAQIAGSLPTEKQPAVGWVLHPSPASPAANRGWAEAAERQLTLQGVWSPAQG